MLLFVLVAVQIDLLLGSEYVRDAVCIGFCSNEILSIVEGKDGGSTEKYSGKKERE